MLLKFSLSLSLLISSKDFHVATAQGASAAGHSVLAGLAWSAARKCHSDIGEAGEMQGGS